MWRKMKLAFNRKKQTGRGVSEMLPVENNDLWETRRLAKKEERRLAEMDEHLIRHAWRRNVDYK